MTDTTPLAESWKSLTIHGRSFRLAAVFLPRGVADDAALLYAMCREIDDLADEATDEEQARADLTRLRNELERRDSPRPLVAAFLQLCKRTNMSIDPMMVLMDGVLGDLQRVRIADDSELIQYGWRVAGTVGLMMSAVLQVSHHTAWKHAIDLGIAMQLTNICRDVAEDAKRNRIYLPASRLEAIGLDSQAVQRCETPDGALAPVVCDVLALADRYYASGLAGTRWIPFRCRLAIRIAARVYRAIGIRLIARGGDPMKGRVVVPFYAKLWHVFLAVVTTPFHGNDTPHDRALHAPLQELPGIPVAWT